MFLPDLVVRSRRVVTPRGTRPAAIHVRSGRVIGVVDFDDVPQGCPLDDVDAAAILPGIVDTHVHAASLNDKTCGLEAVTRAAAAGGVTTIVEMPFPGTATTTVAALESKRRAAAGRCHVDVGFWGGLVAGNASDLAPLFEAGVLGFKSVLRACGGDNFLPVSETDLRMAMPALTRIGATLLAHAELPGPIAEAEARQRKNRRWVERLPWVSRRWHSHSHDLEARPKAAENEAVALLIQLCRQYGTRTHVVHLSSSDTLTPLFHARSSGIPITSETCPQYLYFVAGNMPGDPAACTCAPPVRERENREYLWAALANGLIQMVAGCGLPSLRLSVPVVWTAALARGYALDLLVDRMCHAPSQLSGLTRKGRIDVGYDADFVVFDPDAAFAVEPASLEADSRLAPYLALPLRGVVERTYLRGTAIYSRRGGWGSPRGTFLVRGMN